MKRVLPAVLALALGSPLQAQLPTPHPLPAAGAFMDSAAFAGFVARQVPADAGSRLLLSFVVDSAGTVRSVRTLETGMSPDVTGTIRDSVITFVRPQAPWRGGRWWLRLSIRRGPDIALRTERSREEAPRLTASMPELLRAVRETGQPGVSGRVELRVLVGEDGRVLRVEPGPGHSLGRAYTERLATQLRFSPGSVDGEPQALWTAFRIQATGAR